MEIRKKLLYQFSGSVAVILFLAFLAIYISFAQSRKAEFFDRLSSKAKLVGQMIVDIDEIDLNVLQKIEQNNPLNLANEKIVVFDESRRILFTSDPQRILQIGKDDLEKVTKAEEFHFSQGGYEISGLIYSSRGTRLVVFTAAQDIFGLRKLGMLRNILILVFGITLLVVFFAGRWFAKRALSPIESIISKVDAISISNLNERLGEGNGKDEIAQLAKTFNKMLERLESSFRIQKTFITNASHELRNPLSAISGQLEVVLMAPRSVTDYKKALNSLYNDSLRLNQMANSLLLLAQTSLDGSSHTFVRLRIDDILLEATNEMNRRYKDFQFSITIKESLEDEHLIVQGNELLLKTAFYNLLENGYKYTEDHKVKVEILDIGKNISVIVTDKGIGIPNHELELITNPFFRAQNAQVMKGQGLGLTIVENIIQLHRGTLSIKSSLNKGSVFTVTLPVDNASVIA
jgi:signal transduction histidine kinase